jgi:hypothetical protein
MVDYKLTSNPAIVIRTIDGASIPANVPANVDCAAYAVWLAAGNMPEPIDADAIKAAHNAPILAQIAAIDVFVPRGLEDTWAAMGFDTTKLPAIQQSRLAQKQALRTQLQL